ncbi:MAG TPA: hypothetical protein VGR21_02550 [Cryptosporangiaceae bacterium]|nr:hypothetical protein [Cryptosporangiaceae bacterium]
MTADPAPSLFLVAVRAESGAARTVVGGRHERPRGPVLVVR